MNNTSAWKNFKSTITAPIDPWLFFAMLAIYIMSLFLLYSADGQEFGQLENKTIHTVLGFALLWIIAVFKPQTAAKVALPVYIVGVLLLIGVEVAGVTVNGSTRWLNLGFTRIQPSEIMKIGIPMTVAWYFQRYEGRLKWIHYIVALILILVPVALILKQPDLGTAALIMASGIFVIFFAGLPWKAIFAAIIAFVAALPLLWNYGMHDYQKTRVLTLLDPTKDPLGAGYHIIQSMIAIGSGGVWGKGWLNGTQTHLDYIPESTTDFIFAVFGEEFGLIGNILFTAGLPYHSGTRIVDCCASTIPLQPYFGRRIDHDLFLLCLCKHGHGQRHFARRRCPPPLGQLRRHGYTFHHGGTRPVDGYCQ